MSYALPIILIIIMIVANGIFVAAEFAIVAARKAKFQEMHEQGNAIAKFLLTILKDAESKDRYIAIAQLGITIASIGLGMYGERSIAGWLYGPLEHHFHLSHALAHTFGTIIAVAILTYLHVVIGEMIPKALALQMPEQTALRVANPMRVFGFIFAPVVLVLNAIGMALLRLFGISVAGHGQHYNISELEQLVEESYQGGEVAARQHELIDNIFHFGERTVGQLMTPRTKVQGIAHDASHADIIRLMQETGHSRFPVYKGTLDHVIGILHIKDFVRQQVKGDAADISNIDITKLMRRAPRVPEQSSAQNLLESFKRLKVHMALVVDEFGDCAGMVTLEDLIEEVVGDLQDEYDGQESANVQQQEDGSYLIAGETQLISLQEDYHLALHSDRADTLAGIVIDHLGRAAELADVVKVQGYTLTVRACEGLTIRQIQLQQEGANEEEAGEKEA